MYLIIQRYVYKNTSISYALKKFINLKIWRKNTSYKGYK